MPYIIGFIPILEGIIPFEPDMEVEQKQISKTFCWIANVDNRHCPLQRYTVSGEVADRCFCYDENCPMLPFEV